MSPGTALSIPSSNRNAGRRGEADRGLRAPTHRPPDKWEKLLLAPSVGRRKYSIHTHTYISMHRYAECIFSLQSIVLLPYSTRQSRGGSFRARPRRPDLFEADRNSLGD